MSPEISIIIPVYKVEKYLRRCLDSVKNQTFSNWQAVLVDDGSPDKSGKIADLYEKKDKRFVVIHKENAGVSAARNSGLKIAKGKYIMFLDSDDCIHPQTMEILYMLAEKENVDIVSFEYNRAEFKDPNAVNFPPNKMPEFFNDKYDLKKIKYKRVKNLITKSTNDDYGPKSWYVQNGMIWMRMYKREFISGLKFDTKMKMLEDTCFWSMVLLRRPSGVITRLPLYYYTVNSGSVLHSNTDSTIDIIRGVCRVANEYKKYANLYDMRIWYKRFFWSIFSRILHAAKRMSDKKRKQQIIHEFIKMQQDGLFDIVPDFHAWRYRRRILKFISQNS